MSNWQRKVEDARADELKARNTIKELWADSPVFRVAAITVGAFVLIALLALASS